MSPVKVLQRIVSARKRLRDLSAGEMAVADAKRQEAHGVAEELRIQHEQLIENAAQHLCHASTIRALEMFQDERHGADRAAVKARVVVARHIQIVEKARTQVQRRERDLRGSERQLDTTRREVEAAKDKAEQTAADERSASSMFRKEER